MNDLLPKARREDQTLSGTAVLAGVLVAYGAFAVLISVVAAFANGAHSHQVLSAATWTQLGTGGGIVTGIVLFLAWGAGGFAAARMAGRDGLRHGVWVFIVGLVLITAVAAAITWLPDSTTVLRNLRLLGLPLRRSEWRDIGTIAGVSCLVGMATGAAAGGWWALRQAAPAPAVAPAVVPVAAPLATVAPAPGLAEGSEPVPQPAVAGPSLFEESPFEPAPFEPGPFEPAAAAPEPELEATVAADAEAQP
ncbi:MAG: hypothetical protein JO265_03880, partial [Acidimicrobiia bacterium]|nr:hypothetical protein [Acidimicrobiia bacterium]